MSNQCATEKANVQPSLKLLVVDLDLQVHVCVLVVGIATAALAAATTGELLTRSDVYFSLVFIFYQHGGQTQQQVLLSRQRTSWKLE